MDLERDKALEDLERLPHAVSGDAAANREELLDQRHHGSASASGTGVHPQGGLLSRLKPNFPLIVTDD